MDRSKVYFTRMQSRLVDQLAIAEGISSLDLMENAGQGCVRELLDRGVESAVICAGTGNNGGDGFVIARELGRLNIKVKTIICGPVEQISGDARINWQIACHENVPMTEIDQSCSDQSIEAELRPDRENCSIWIVDAMLGTGATGNPRAPMDRIIRIANRSNASRMAIDIPTGLDCDTGVPGNPTFRADVTCTFVAQKIGFKNESAWPWLGEIKVIPIGVPECILERIASSVQRDGT